MWLLSHVWQGLRGVQLAGRPTMLKWRVISLGGSAELDATSCWVPETNEPRARGIHKTLYGTKPQFVENPNACLALGGRHIPTQRRAVIPYRSSDKDAAPLEAWAYNSQSTRLKRKGRNSYDHFRITSTVYRLVSHVEVRHSGVSLKKVTFYLTSLHQTETPHDWARTGWICFVSVRSALTTWSQLLWLSVCFNGELSQTVLTCSFKTSIWISVSLRARERIKVHSALLRHEVFVYDKVRKNYSLTQPANEHCLSRLALSFVSDQKNDYHVVSCIQVR